MSRAKSGEDPRASQAVAMYMAGARHHDITSSLHACGGTVQRWLREAGVPLRGGGNHGPARRGGTPAHTPESFWSLVEKTGSCWLWNGGTDDSGYGVIRYENRVWKAHRLAYSLTHGTIPYGKIICHRCDNPPCVNPEHLYAGTQLDNVHDRDNRGRGDWSKAATGERHSQAKLTWVQVNTIRARCAAGACQRHLAFEYGVAPSTINRIIRNELWVAA